MKTPSFTMSIVAAFVCLLGFLPTISAFFRLSCNGPLLLERADPIVNSGAISNHLHSIVGSNAFNFSMTYEDARAATCSTCKVKADLSAYWTPTLAYRAKNGSFHLVKHEGATIYYLQRRGNDAEKVKAFPAGFRMLAGDPFVRSFDQNNKEQQAISWACVGLNMPDFKKIPDIKNCPYGLRAGVFFPSCWDGKNLDSPNHKSHMAYPSGVDIGSCPSSHPVRLVSLFMEVVFDINSWQNQWYSDKHPFVLSTGDQTGYSLHGDFLNGWNVDVLQKAIDTCHSGSGALEECEPFKNNMWNDDQMRNCEVPPRLGEQTTGWMRNLPGCPAISSGPQRDAGKSTCDISTKIGSPEKYYTDMREKGWEYVGCANDAWDPRRLPDAMIGKGDMTIEHCIDHCDSKGFSLSGTQYGNECWCGNSLGDVDFKTLAMNKCRMPCAGDAKQYCGDGLKLSVYKKMTASADRRDLGEVMDKRRRIRRAQVDREE